MRTHSGTAPPDSSPSLLARVLAFAAIVVSGVCGGVIGYAVTDFGCYDGCGTTAGLIGLGSAVAAAVGVAVVAILVLRASAEWHAAEPAPHEGGREVGRSATAIGETSGNGHPAPRSEQGR